MVFNELAEFTPTQLAFRLEGLNEWFFPNNFSLNYETAEPYLQKEYDFSIDYQSEMVITIKNRIASGYNNKQSQKREITWIKFHCILENMGFFL
jgi:hypothetical protein